MDGNEVPVLVADAALMGIEVPEGSHQVELSFTDEAFSSGLKATVAGLALLGLLLFVAKRREAQAEQAKEPAPA